MNHASIEEGLFPYLLWSENRLLTWIKGRCTSLRVSSPGVPSKLCRCCLHLMVNSVTHKETMQGSLKVHIPADSVPKDEGDPSSNKNPSSPAPACLTGYVHFLSERSSLLHICRFHFCGPDRSI